MARQALNPQQIVRAALTPSYTAAHVDGFKMPNDGRAFIIVKTTDTGTVLTIQTPNTVDGLAIAERTVTIAFPAERVIGPFPPNDYNQASGEVYFDFSVLTNVTIAAFQP